MQSRLQPCAKQFHQSPQRWSSACSIHYIYASRSKARCDKSACAATMSVDVAIAGGGPAGLAAAVALHKADPSLSIRVFERTNMNARGAAVMVGVNGLLALNAIDPQLPELLLRKAIRLEGSERYNMDTGQFIEFMAMRNDDMQSKYGFHNSLLGWADITEALRSALPADAITSNTAVTGFKQLDDGTVQLLGSSSSSSDDFLGKQQDVLATTRLVVGADGWFSRVREQLLADGPPTFKDAIVFRARMQRPPDNSIITEHRTKWWVPPGGPAQGKLLAVLIPVPGGEMVWQAHCPLDVFQQKGLSFDPVTGEAGGASSHASVTDDPDLSSTFTSSHSSIKERALKAFDTFPDAFLDVVRATPAHAITEHGLYQRTPEQIPDDSWGSGMVTLVGDAAHTAFVDGTGLGLALEDAAILAWHVQQQGLTEAALRAYEKERIPRLKEVFSLAAKQAEAMAKGVPQRQLLDARAELLYGQAKFQPLHAAVPAVSAV